MNATSDEVAQNVTSDATAVDATATDATAQQSGGLRFLQDNTAAVAPGFIVAGAGDQTIAAADNATTVTVPVLNGNEIFFDIDQRIKGFSHEFACAIPESIRQLKEGAN